VQTEDVLDAPELLRGCQILIIDDEVPNLRTLERVLDRAGYRDVSTFVDPVEAVRAFESRRPDLLLLDLHMPDMDGFQVLEVVRRNVADDEYLPVLVLTGDLDPAVRRDALAAGARDFLTKPFEVTEVLLRIKNLLETRNLHRRIQAHAHELEDRVEERTRELARAKVEILERLARAAEYRDDVTGRHATRVGVLSARLGDALGLDDERIRILRRAAPLHDVGKIGIPDAILLKPGPLSDAEFEVMKGHTSIGARILGGSSHALLQAAKEIALTHHERWDGDGYEGLAGEEIPLEGRIVTVADAFDCMTHERPYRTPADLVAVIEEVVENRGRQFDPTVASALLGLTARGDLFELELDLAVADSERARAVEAAREACDE
jgi:putative two-component system response regulator